MKLISCFFFFNDTATTEIYTLSLHDALPILAERLRAESDGGPVRRWYSRRGGRRSSDVPAPELAAAPDPAVPPSPRRGAVVTAGALALGGGVITVIGAALVARPDRPGPLDPDLVAGAALRGPPP